jgi:hypothetical protein
MKRLLLLLGIACACAMAQPVLVQSPLCPDATPCVPAIETGSDLASPNSFRIAWATDVITRRQYLKCGLTSGTYDLYIQDHRPTSAFSETIRAKGWWLRFSGAKPSTTYYCVVGSSVNTDGTGGTVESGEIAYTTPAKSASAWTPINHPDLPDTMTMPTPTVSYTVASDCSDLQTKYNQATTDHASANTVNREIVIPVGAACGQLVENNHTTGTGWLIIRSSAVGTSAFPPDGTQVDPVRYQSKMARIRSSFKSSQFAALAVNGSDAAIYTTDGSKRIWHKGIIIESTPTVDNLVVRSSSTCSPGSGTNTSVSVPNLAHNLATGRKVFVSNSSNISLNNQWFSMTSTGAQTFTLDGTSGVTGSSASCSVSVYGDMELTNCGPGTAGTRCDVVLPGSITGLTSHGLVTGTIGKVLSYDAANDDWISYQGTYGFGGRTDATQEAVTDQITVVDNDTIEFNGRTPNGVYGGGARLMVDANTAAPGAWFPDSPMSDHIVFDQVWFHARGLLIRMPQGVHYACASDCLLRDSVVDPNGQWSFTVPGTTTEQRALGYVINQYNVNIDQWRLRCAAINNKIGYHLLGLAAASGNSTMPIPAQLTVDNNDFYFPESFRMSLTNPAWNGLDYLFNRQALEFKAGEYISIQANRFFGSIKGQDVGAPFVLASRPNTEGAAGYEQSFRNRVSFVLIRNNTIFSHGIGPDIYAANTSNNPNTTAAIKNIFMDNNIIVVDGTRYGVASNPGNGACIWIGKGVENTTITRNLCLQRGSADHSMLLLGTLPASGLKVKNNIFVFHHNMASHGSIDFPANGTETTYLATYLGFPASTDSWGSWAKSNLNLGGSTTVYDAAGQNGVVYQGLDPTAEFSNNLIVTGVKGSAQPNSSDSSSSTSVNALLSECNTSLGPLVASTNYPRNKCWDGGSTNLGTGNNTFLLRSAALKFVNFDRTAGPFQIGTPYDFHLRYDSPLKSGASSASSALCAGGSTDQCLNANDGKDLGPDVDELDAAQGKLGNVRVYGIGTTTATIGYTAPGPAALCVDYWTGNNTPTRSCDAGGASRLRAVSLSGLSASTKYNYIVHGLKSEATRTFSTN